MSSYINNGSYLVSGTGTGLTPAQQQKLDSLPSKDWDITESYSTDSIVTSDNGWFKALGASPTVGVKPMDNLGVNGWSWIQGVVRVSAPPIQGTITDYHPEFIKADNGSEYQKSGTGATAIYEFHDTLSTGTGGGSGTDVSSYPDGPKLTYV